MAEVRLNGLCSGTSLPWTSCPARRWCQPAKAAHTTVMVTMAGSSAGSRARFTTSTSTTTRAKLTVQASRMPLTMAELAAAYCGSWLCRENDRVTAVDETRPPVNPVSGMPRCVPSIRVST